MEKGSKIYIAGHRGLVGSALLTTLQEAGYYNIVTRTHTALDLTNQEKTRQFFDQEEPEYIFLAAAFVGGILANSRYRADFIANNLAIQQNVITESFRHRAKKLLFLGSSCIYPRLASQPIREDALLTGELEITNEPYAIAKIAGIKLCESFNMQYGTDYISVMPTNLYGPNDNFDLTRSHLLPAILRKMHLAKSLRKRNFVAIRKDLALSPIEGIDVKNITNSELEKALSSWGITAQTLLLWGTGTPLRELMWSIDMAEASLYIMEHISSAMLQDKEQSFPTNTHINIGTGIEHSIAEIAKLVQEEVGFEGQIAFDGVHPDGTPRKLLDVGRLKSLGWQAHTTLSEGLKKYYNWYLTRN